MGENLDRLERRIAELDQRLSRIARQVETLIRGPSSEENGVAGISEAPASDPVEEAADRTTPWSTGKDIEDLIARHGLVVLAGLSSLVMAGAVVLRILTLNSPVPLTVGAAIGLVYCVGLLFVADRMIRRDRRLYGDTFAALSVLILVSLLVEVARLPHGFSRETAYAILAAVFGLYSVGSVLRRRVVPFSIGLLAAPLAGLAICGVPFHHPIFASIIGISVLVAHFGMSRNRWEVPRLVPGIVSILYLIVLIFLAAAVARRDLPQHALAAPVYSVGIFTLFFVLYTAAAARIALFRPRRLDVFEITLAVAMALLTFSGVASALTSLPSGAILCGALGGGVALLFYGVAVISYVRHGAESGSFYPLSAIAFLYAMASFALLLGVGPRLGLAYQGLALALALFAARYRKRSISFQSLCLTGAAFGVMAVTAFEVHPPEARAGTAGSSVIWLLATGVLAVATFARLRADSAPAVGARTALVFVLAAGTAELLSGALEAVYPAAGHLLGTGTEREASGLWLTCQTLLLIFGALLILLATLRFRLGAALILSVALMGTAGVKLFTFDAFRVPALHLVCSASVFGGALILSSILYRRSRGLTSPGTPESVPPEVHS